jgi:hypothetical protein
MALSFCVGKLGKVMKKKYGRNVYSQNGEDGIIEECLKRIGIKKGVSVEFGAPNDTFCSNTANLDPFGFTKHYYDPNPECAVVHKRFITPENVNELPECDVLSIDIDGNDYEVWKAYKGKPAIVIIEINSSLNPDEDFFTPEQGCNFSKMNKLAKEKGYFLVSHTGNCIYVDSRYRGLFSELFCIDTMFLFDRSWLLQQA